MSNNTHNPLSEVFGYPLNILTKNANGTANINCVHSTIKYQTALKTRSPTLSGYAASSLTSMVMSLPVQLVSDKIGNFWTMQPAFSSRKMQNRLLFPKFD